MTSTELRQQRITQTVREHQQRRFRRVWPLIIPITLASPFIALWAGYADELGPALLDAWRYVFKGCPCTDCVASRQRKEE